MRRWKLLLFFTACVCSLPILAIPIARAMGAGALHPAHRALTPSLIAQANEVFRRDSAQRQDVSITVADGIALKGWFVTPKSMLQDFSTPADWVLLFHGSGDNRTGTLGFADFLLRAGFCVTMMDSRAHGESGGDEATFGWKERADVRAIVDALESRYAVRHLFAMGVSMGAGIALQSAAFDPRIEAVIAEAPFASLREAGYDYVTFRQSPWLGHTVFRAAARAGIDAMEKAGGFNVDESSPELAVRQRAFPILLIEDGADSNLPRRHGEIIYAAAIGTKQMWTIPGACHACGFGTDSTGYERHVLDFFSSVETNRRLTVSLQ